MTLGEMVDEVKVRVAEIIAKEPSAAMAVDLSLRSAEERLARHRESRPAARTNQGRCNNSPCLREPLDSSLRILVLKDEEGSNLRIREARIWMINQR